MIHCKVNLTLTHDQLTTLHAALINARLDHTERAERLRALDDAECQAIADDHAADARSIDALDMCIRRQVRAQ